MLGIKVETKRLKDKNFEHIHIYIININLNTIVFSL